MFTRFFTPVPAKVSQDAMGTAGHLCVPGYLCTSLQYYIFNEKLSKVITVKKTNFLQNPWIFNMVHLVIIFRNSPSMFMIYLLYTVAYSL